MIRTKLLLKMIIVYSLLTVIPLTLVTGISYLNSQKIIEKKIADSANRTLIETVDKIEGILQVMEKVLDDLANDQVVKTLLKNDYDKITYPMTEARRHETESTLKETLNLQLSGDSIEEAFINSIYIFNNTEKYYTTETNGKVQYYDALKVLPYDKEGRPQWAFFMDNSQIICSIEIIDNVTGKLGFIAIMLNPDKVRQLYAGYPENTFYVTNDFNLILSASNLEEVGSLFTDYSKPETILNRRVSKDTGFIYISMVSTEDLNKEIKGLAYFSSTITLITWFVVLLLTILILKHITNPLRRLSRLMRKAEKEHFELIQGVKTEDEVGQLCHSYNRLITEFQYLIQEVYKMEVLNKEAELKLIKMQINPHFLYNTLETISALSVSDAGKESIPQITQLMAKIFRFSITPGGDYVPMETEIEFANAYLQLQKFRFKERLSWKIDLPDEFKRVKIPKLILQPIIENAVIHGIRHSSIKGMIILRVYDMDYDLMIEVEDNGPGFDNEGQSGGLGTGLHNVDSRIRLLYGETYGISILKSDENGTVVLLRMPIQMNGELISNENHDSR
ncbi:sensor histidine kinase [Paenibacillus psychroresistens]|nr:histidine kinase [Paenibacillus psychroresistens]